MRHNLLETTALSASAAFLAGAASAADIPRPVTKAPALVQAPAYSWTGCYAGLNAGASWTRLDQNLAVPDPVNANFALGGQDTGFTGGGQVGCNWQYVPNWVFGLEGDFNYLSAKRTGRFAFSEGSEDVAGSMETKLRWLATVRGRFGHTWGHTMLFATGGLAFGDVKSSVNAVSLSSANAVLTGTFAGSVSQTRVGWSAGAGVEHAFGNQWSAKLEYLYFDLGSFNYLVNLTSGSPDFAPTTWSTNGKIDGHIVRLGLNYRFSP
jgi:outer membrane immunogenic protein